MRLQFFAREPTEPATPRRLEKAREQGQVFRSPEVVAVATLLAAYLALVATGAWTWDRLSRFAVRWWGDLSRMELTPGNLPGLAWQVVATALLAAAPVAGLVLAAGLLANYLQVGFLFTLRPLAPDLRRIDPIQGLRRILSRRALAELVKSLAKVAVVGWVAYRTVAGALPKLPLLLGSSPGGVLAETARLVGLLLGRVALTMAVLAFLDYLYQRWEYFQSLRMTREEIKEELRETEGSPEIRQAIRRRQRELARRRMMAEVPKADVVVTNPTHYAVALRYVPGEMEAPVVVAKGRGFVALRIREVAAAADVPVVENPELARGLYFSVEIGDPVPPELYRAVAEVLAFVYRLKGKV
ncbi:MAG: flagellar biosynthesis protein FlhB [Bacillota bacterium]|nr:MAG: flagellar biosynthesis protein FlhB [Bacillota bacterium]